MWMLKSLNSEIWRGANIARDLVPELSRDSAEIAFHLVFSFHPCTKVKSNQIERFNIIG